MYEGISELSVGNLTGNSGCPDVNSATPFMPVDQVLSGMRI